MKPLFLLLIFANTINLVLSQPASIQDTLPTLKHNNLDKLLNRINQFSLHGYGAVNYNSYNWQTDTAKRNNIDLERFVLEPTFKFSKSLSLNAELEIEHGGTGSSVEFDRFEEFGEFEFEIEKGGEVNLEQLNIEWNYKNYLNVKGGRIKVPIGFYYKFDEPTEYFTPLISETESHLLPTSWTEFGISLFGYLDKKHKFNYVTGIVNSLDNSAFSSSTWIKRGNQKRFETVNAENWAGFLRLDYQLNKHILLGIATYFGNTTDNRPKPDIKIPGYVSLSEFHTAILYKALEVKTLILFGELSNAEKISEANRNLSNNLNAKRTPIGSSVLGIYGELGIDILKIFKTNIISKQEDALILYGRIDYYDSMYTTEGNIFNNPRWERTVWSIGLNYRPIEEIIIKTSYSSRRFGIPQRNLENTFTLGFGFAF